MTRRWLALLLALAASAHAYSNELEALVDRQPGDAFRDEPVTHTVENLGTNDIHNLIVELKDR